VHQPRQLGVPQDHFEVCAGVDFQPQRVEEHDLGLGYVVAR
jgi:hypothetical protein